MKEAFHFITTIPFAFLLYNTTQTTLTDNPRCKIDKINKLSSVDL